MKKFEYKKLSEIQKEKNDSDLTYADLLSTIEWREFRSKIINRDNGKCLKCGERNNQLAWWIDGPFEVFARLADDVEKKYLREDIILSSEHIILNVHHKYYIKGKYPWEYEQDSLMTGCSMCHTKIHDTEEILIYENENLENPKIVTKCNKCKGTGYLNEYQYHMNGICFGCNGKGILN